jgi:hypothetical protein
MMAQQNQKQDWFRTASPVGVHHAAGSATFVMQAARARLSTASLLFAQSEGRPKEDQIQGLGFLVAAAAVAAAAEHR